MQKKYLKIMVAAILCACLAIGAGAGFTLAYIFAKTPQVNNSFEPVFVSCLVEESFDGVTKSDVRVRNTGDIDAYIRATFVVMWTSEEGAVYGAQPIANTDYAIELGSQKWMKGSDGFYYYSNPVSAGAATDVLIQSITILTDAPEGYGLSVHVSATAIQTQPAEAIYEVWGASVENNGNLIAP